jgi:putative transposase
MNSMESKHKLLGLIAEAQADGASLKSICTCLGVSERTIQRWKQHKGNLSDKRKESNRHIPHKLSQEERRMIIRICTSREYIDMYPHEIVADLASKGIYIASESSFYRVLREERMLSHRRSSKPPVSRTMPVHVATGPDQVYSWDITWVKTDVAGIYYYLYMVMDIWSRMIIHWELHERESSAIASRMLGSINAKKDIRGVVLHSDNGSPMKGFSMLSKMYQLQVMPSFSRPRVSEDNPYSESLFRTMKYRPLYPGSFLSLDDARQWVKGFVHWYNREHMHSGIQFVTPHDRHYGQDIEILETRRKTYQEAYSRNPARWSRKPKSWEQEKVVGINYQPDKKRMHLAS